MKQEEIDRRDMETKDLVFYTTITIMYVYFTIVDNIFFGWMRSVLNGVGITLFIVLWATEI